MVNNICCQYTFDQFELGFDFLPEGLELAIDFSVIISGKRPVSLRIPAVRKNIDAGFNILELPSDAISDNNTPFTFPLAVVKQVENALFDQFFFFIVVCV